MRHKNRLRRLNRTGSERKALLKSLVVALLKRQRITTTVAKAKEARRLAEKAITLGKKGDLASQRRLFSMLLDKDVIKELVTEIAPRFKNRQGGYTRILRISGRRKGDNAPMVILELTEQKVIVPVTKKSKKAEKAEVVAERPAESKKEATGEPKKEEAPKHKKEEPKHIKEERRPPREDRKHPMEKGKKGFFQNLKKFLKPKTGL